MTRHQSILLSELGAGWQPELSIIVDPPQDGYPYAYDVDLGCEHRKVAIEIDGSGHRLPEQRKRDLKKDAMLRSLGWTVFRFWNHDVMAAMKCSDPMESRVWGMLATAGIRREAGTF